MRRLFQCIIISGVLLTFILSHELVAQETPHLAPGVRVRVPIFNGRIVGTVISIVSDTLTLKLTESPNTLVIPLKSVTKIEVSRGRIPFGKNLLKGAGIGFLVGVSVMGVIGSNKASSDADGPGRVLFVAGLGGLYGLVIGSFVGAVTAHERWQEVSLEEIKGDYTP